MRLLIFLCLLSISSATSWENWILLPISKRFQRFCLKRSENLIQMRAPVESLVCGKKPDRRSSLYHSLIHLGLLHIFVVSGSHLTFLAFALKNVLSRAFLLSFLAGFVLMTGAEPPAVRAWIYFAIFFQSHLLNQGPPSYLIASLLFTLCLFSWQDNAISIALTWVSCLVMILTQGQNLFRQAAAFYLSLFPILFFLNVPHPVSIIASAWLTPIIGTVLLPSAIFTWMLPWLEPLTSLVWHLCLGLMGWARTWVPEPLSASDMKPMPFLCFLYATLFHLVVATRWTYQRRQQLCQPRKSY